jgi:tetratricopeptide (TPR) repeat protein
MDHRLSLLRTSALVLSLSVATVLTADPRPISPAEREAVRIAADYLSRGPVAIVDNLSSTSPLRHLTPAEQLAEIEARLGPNSGATWELQTVMPALAASNAVFGIEFPTGVDDAAQFELKQENGAFKINDIHVLAERSLRTQYFPAESDQPKHEDPGPNPMTALLMTTVLVALLAVTGALVIGKQAMIGRITIAGAIVLGALVIGRTVTLEPKPEPKPVPVAKKVAPSYLRLASLLPLRRAAAGLGDVDAAFAQAPPAGDVRDVAEIWKAQVEIQQTKLPEAKKRLKRFPSPSTIPLAELLRARLAQLEGDEASSALSYEYAVNIGPGRDGLWVETAQALGQLGFDKRAIRYLKNLVRIGSRKSDVYYLLALTEVMDNRDEASRKILLRAWAMKPELRSELVNVRLLWAALRSPDVVPTISLAAPDEPAFASPDLGKQPIPLPPNAVTRVSGSFLNIKIDNQELLVPGGAVLAPPTSQVVSASAWAADDDQKALRDLDELMKNGRGETAFTQPALRRRMLATASALAAHNRWQDLVRLTDGITPRAPQVPPDIIFMRSKALQRLHSSIAARDELAELAGSGILQQKKDSKALVELGESLAAFDLFGPALKMFEKAQAVHNDPSLDDRMRQISLNETLATKSQMYQSTHFDIRYPDDYPPQAAKQICDIAEAELIRLQGIVPAPNFQHVTINIVKWEDFRSIYTGNDFILGFYQGKITLPFGNVGDFQPEIVAILTHELCHAMIADATNDQAPRWFHEGLAQRVEMRDFHPNALNMYDDNRLLAMSLLDSVMDGSPDPDMIGEAYIEAQTVIRYLETAYGPKAIPMMLNAFRDGATTEEAIQKVAHTDMGGLDIKLRAWGRAGAKVFANPPPIRYDQTPDNDITWAAKPR